MKSGHQIEGACFVGYVGCQDFAPCSVNSSLAIHISLVSTHFARRNQGMKWRSTNSKLKYPLKLARYLQRPAISPGFTLPSSFRQEKLGENGALARSRCRLGRAPRSS